MYYVVLDHVFLNLILKTTVTARLRIVVKHLPIIPMPLHPRHGAHLHEDSNMHIQNIKIYLILLDSPIVFSPHMVVWCYHILSVLANCFLFSLQWIMCFN